MTKILAGLKRKSKLLIVYTADQWYDVIRASRRRFPFVVNAVSQEDVKNLLGI